jgi:hypothetical protein
MHLGKFNVPIWVIMLAVLPVSLAGWACVDYLKGPDHHFLREILGRLLEAIAIASILGATIDGFLKVAIVKDVFQVSLGYLLPEQLRPHMRWIYEHRLICTADFITIELTQDSDDCLRLYGSRTQTLENISNKSVKETPALSIDEWNMPNRKSQILAFTCQTDKDSWPDGSVLTTERGDHNNPTVKAKKFKIDPRQKLYIRSEFEEWKRMTDDFLYHYKYPTNKTHVTVKAPDTLKYEVAFATIGSPSIKLNSTWILDAATLPSQYVRVWWWPKSEQTPRI